VHGLVASPFKAAYVAGRSVTGTPFLMDQGWTAR
jgi:hypothetical protein